MATHTQTLLTSWSADMSITKEEIIDVDVLAVLSKSDDLSSEDHAKLRTIKRKLIRGRYLDSVYKLGKNIKSADGDLGRLCVLRSIGLQALPRQIRSALAQKHYWDVDIANCHPTIAMQLCEKMGISCVEQKVFLENRDRLRGELAEHLQIDDGKVKERINALYFGYASACHGMPEFFTKLQAEIFRARDLIVGHPDWCEQVKFLKGKENRVGRAFSYILQTIERSCLLELDRSATRNQRSLDVYIHDGGLIRKLDGEKAFPPELLKVFESDIDKTGYTVRLAVKPLLTDLDVSLTSDANYLVAKTEFEKECFKVNDPPCYVRIYDSRISLLDIGKLGHIYANKFVDGELFINKWRADADNLTYERIQFLPELTAPPDTYNLWRGFPLQQNEGDVSVIRDVLRLICNNDVASMTYLEDWLAHLFQKPYEKPGVCICTQSDEEGTGKDTFWGFIGQMVGSHMYFNTSRPEDTVFGRFNGSLKEVMLIKFEEANFETNKKNEDALKSLITSTDQSYEAKNENAVTLNSYCRLVMTTNHTIPFVLTDVSRRFMMLKVSPEKVGDRAYWTRVHTTLATPEARNAYYDYLMKRDISKFNPREFPRTAYAEEVMTASRPTAAAYFQRIIERDDLNEQPDATHEWKARDLLDKMNDSSISKYPLNDRLFGLMMKKMAPALERVRDRTGSSYRFETKTMRTFLVEKHWWVEL